MVCIVLLIFWNSWWILSESSRFLIWLIELLTVLLSWSKSKLAESSVLYLWNIGACQQRYLIVDIFWFSIGLKSWLYRSISSNWDQNISNKALNENVLLLLIAIFLANSLVRIYQSGTCSILWFYWKNDLTLFSFRRKSPLKNFLYLLSYSHIASSDAISCNNDRSQYRQ